MESNVQMRSSLDRIRHALLFEVILLALTIFALVGIFHKPVAQMGALSIALSVTAMVWNYIYNWIFDHVLVRLRYPLYPSSIKLRAGHAILFELGLMAASLPMIMFAMKLSFLQALALDVSMVLAVLVYTLIFNYGYDQIFPVPQSSK